MFRNAIALFSASLVFCFSSSTVKAQAGFVRHSVTNNLNGAYWAYARDVDGDGNMDLTTAEYQGISLWSGDGNGGFSRTTLGALKGAWGTFAEDIDGDGRIDVLGVSPTTDEVVWYKNNGGGFNTGQMIDNAGMDPEAVSAADFDGDGDNDVVVAMWEDGEIVWYEYQGGNNWVKNVLDSGVSGAHSVWTADFNNDGRPDIAASGSGKTMWYRNEGGSFTKRTLSSNGALSVFAADIDGDGWMDILRTQRNNGDVDWFKNSGGSFSEINIAQNFEASWSVSAGDIDGDGDVDVVAAGFEKDVIMAWFNDGNQNFGSGVVVDQVNRPRAVFAGKIDKDSDDDIVSAIRGDSDLAWYEALGGIGTFEEITISSPQSNETYTPGQNVPISWSYVGSFGFVDIEFSTDNGLNWSLIADDEINNGSYSWIAPNENSQECRIRISDAADAKPSSQSDAFSIFTTANSLSLLQPNDGGAILSESEYEIKWTSLGVINNINIDLSINNGMTWSPVVSSVANDGSYLWTTPYIQSSDCKIRISDAADSSVSDISRDIFSISASPGSLPEISGLFPTEGAPGTRVFVAGRYFDGIVGLEFDNALHPFEIFSDKYVTFVITDSLGAAGTIKIITSNGLATSADSFKVISSDAIASQLYLATDDAQIKIDSPDYNYGFADSMNVESGRFTSYLRFNVVDLVDVLSAKIRVFAESGAGAECELFLSENSLSDGSGEWNEHIITAANAPAISGSSLSSQIVAGDSQYVDFDLGDVIGEPGQYSFAITGLASGQARYASKENIFPPQLIISYAPELDSGVVAVNDTVLVFEDRVAVLDLLQNDQGSAGSLLLDSLKISVSPAHGILTVNLDENIVSYLPDNNFFGQDSFGYKIGGLDGDSNLATVFIEVKSVNDAPVALDDNMKTGSGQSIRFLPLKNDYDLDSAIDSASVNIVFAPKNGTLSQVYSDGGVTYTSDALFLGLDSLVYWFRDVDGAWSNQATVHIEVAEINAPPVIEAYFPQELTPAYSQRDTINFTVSASDANGDSLAYLWLLNQDEVSREAAFDFVRETPLQTNYEVKVVVTDGALSDSVTWNIDLVTGLGDAPKIPTEFSVSRNYPNPFNPQTRIEFSLPETARVIVIIYDLLGRRVRVLLNEELAAGAHYVDWKTLDGQGKKVGSGVYLYHVEAGSYRYVGKMLFVQ